MADSSPPKPTRRLSPDMIAALSAVLVGVCALGISLYQASIMREQSRLMRQEQKASVWPNIAVENSYSVDSFKLRVVNTGIGPAKIGPVRVSFDDKPISTWTELLREIHPEKSIPYSQSQVGERVAPAGEFETVFWVSEDSVAKSVKANLERLAIEICYCSVYEDCWQIHHRFDGDVLRSPVERCQATENDFLQ